MSKGPHNNDDQQRLLHGTLLHLRDEATGELCAVRKSGSITLQHLRDDLMVSSVIECDEHGHPIARALALSDPDAVLRSGRTYIARREVRRRLQQQTHHQPDQQPLANDDVKQRGPGVPIRSQQQLLGPITPDPRRVQIRPVVTFNSNVTIRELLTRRRKAARATAA